jgi:hypothetical protein
VVIFGFTLKLVRNDAESSLPSQLKSPTHMGCASVRTLLCIEAKSTLCIMHEYSIPTGLTASRTCVMGERGTSAAKATRFFPKPVTVFALYS